jgi:hypothetical protein
VPGACADSKKANEFFSALPLQRLTPTLENNQPSDRRVLQGTHHVRRPREKGRCERLGLGGDLDRALLARRRDSARGRHAKHKRCLVLLCRIWRRRHGRRRHGRRCRQRTLLLHIHVARDRRCRLKVRGRCK